MQLISDSATAIAHREQNKYRDGPKYKESGSLIPIFLGKRISWQRHSISLQNKLVLSILTFLLAGQIKTFANKSFENMIQISSPLRCIFSNIGKVV